MEIALERIYSHRLALPQVGAALLFSQEVPPALLLAPEARLRRYRDLSAFGARVYVNPGLEALEEKALFVFPGRFGGLAGPLRLFGPLPRGLRRSPLWPPLPEAQASLWPLLGPGGVVVLFFGEALWEGYLRLLGI
jgi:hypothetical protein